jgi:magnesium-transporting ATPase (P-type)
MAKKNAIIRVLPAVETLGSVTAICSDKTGTLTKNEMTLVAFVTSDKRWRFDVNASDRSPTNFWVDQTYLATRANHAKFLKASDVIRRGPSADRRSRRGGLKPSKSFPFGVTIGFGKTAHGGVEPEEPTPVVAEEGQDDNLAMVGGPKGESPDALYLRQALGGGILCSKCVLGEDGGRNGEIGNPTELAILRASYFGSVNVSEVKDSAPFIAEVPFSSEYKFMATVHEPVEANDTKDYLDELVVHVKGAPDRMIPLCKYQAKGGSFAKADLEPCDSKYWIEQIAILSSHGLRVLALTRGSVPRGEVTNGQQLGPGFVLERGGPWLSIVGLCAIMDPPRPECVQAVAEAHKAGVRIAMITGDHRDTALAIGCMLGLVDKEHSEAITGPELDAMTDDELRIAVKKYNVFARASPQNKIRIVKALQAEGEVCGMTGDGTNDAPALKAADMGVAMGKEGTDVAREASEMILVGTSEYVLVFAGHSRLSSHLHVPFSLASDDNFASIIAAVREGRVVWDNLRKVLLVNTAINNAQGLSVLFGIACGLGYSPLSSIQVLYSNLICACSLGFVTAVEPAEDGIMDVPPRRVNKRLTGRFLLLRIAIGTAALVIAVVGSSFWAQTAFGNGKDGMLNIRGQALNVLNFGALSITASARFARKSAFHIRSFQNNRIAIYSYALMVILQVLILYIPGVNNIIFSQTGLKGWQWGVTLLMTFGVFVVMEVEKCIRNYLTFLKYDTDDRESDDVFDLAPEPDAAIPEEVGRFGKNELLRH